MLTSISGICSIQFKPFWLLQLPVTGEQAAALPKNIARVIFVILANKYGTTYLP